MQQAKILSGLYYRKVEPVNERMNESNNSKLGCQDHPIIHAKSMQYQCRPNVANFTLHWNGIGTVFIYCVVVVVEAQVDELKVEVLSITQAASYLEWELM